MIRRKVIRALALNLLLSLSSVVIFLYGLEWITRRIQPRMPYLLLPTEYNCMRRSTTYSLELRPSCSGVLSRTSFATNSLGMRGPELRADGSLRILALGDSCTWGWGVDQEESYPAVLQRLLDARPSVTRYQLMNAGVPGYTSYQGITYLRERGMALDPGIVIVGFGFNDATPTGDVERQIDFERRWMRFIEFDDYMLTESWLYRWLRFQTAGKRLLRGERVPLDRYVANLEAMIDLATSHQAHVVLLNFWLRASRPRWHDSVDRLARTHGLPFIDYDGPRFDVVHPTAEGQQLLAEEILAAMEGAGYLQ